MEQHSPTRSTTIHLISQNGIPKASKMGSDLVKPSSVKNDLQQAAASTGILEMDHLHHLRLRILPSIGDHGFATAVGEGQFDKPRAGNGRMILAKTQVCLSKLASLELELSHVGT